MVETNSSVRDVNAYTLEWLYNFAKCSGHAQGNTMDGNTSRVLVPNTAGGAASPEQGANGFSAPPPKPNRDT